MLVQVGLCRTCLETTLLVFPRGGSYVDLGISIYLASVFLLIDATVLERSLDFYLDFHIRKTCPCNVYPLEPHFYIEKLGYAGVYLFFLFLL